MRTGVLVVALLGCSRGKAEESRPAVSLTAQESAQLAELTAATKAAIVERDGGWAAAVKAVDASGVEGAGCDRLPSLPSNPQTWRGWPVASPLRFNASSISSFGSTPFPLAFGMPGQPMPQRSPEALGRLARIEEAAARGHATFAERAAAVEREGQLLGVDVFVQIDEVVEPKLGTNNRYAGGRLVVRAWAYDHKLDAVVCAGRATATSSDSVDPRSDNLSSDLLINLVRTLPTALRAVSVARPRTGPTASSKVVGEQLTYRSLNGKTFEMRFGRVRRQSDSEIEVALTSREEGCDAPTGPRPSDVAHVTLSVPAGPGGTFYAGRTFGVPVFAGDGTAGLSLSEAYVSVALDAVDLRANGVVRGRLELGELGAGAFAATVCPGIDTAKVRALPRASAVGAFEGKLGGAPFTVRSAVVGLDVRDSSSTLLAIELFAAPGVTCANRKSARDTRLSLSKIGGVSSKLSLLGAPQPAMAWLERAPGADPVYFESTAVWVQIDKIAYTPGGWVVGSAVIAGPDGSLASGQFRAEVCGR